MHGWKLGWMKQTLFSHWNVKAALRITIFALDIIQNITKTTEKNILK